jgi:transposase-like protein
MNKPKTGQATAPDWTLTAEQATAVDLLASGKTVAETAQALDAESQTIRQWRTQHYGVQAALNGQASGAVGRADTPVARALTQGA